MDLTEMGRAAVAAKYEVQKMTAEEMAAICEALGVPYDYFYRRAGNQPGA